MFRLFSIGRLSALLALSCVANASLAACEDYCDVCDCSKFYIGGFGGGIYSNSTHATQMGTAFFTEAEGGPLAVLAEGPTKRTSSAFGGAQIGYEWSRFSAFSENSCWSISPAAEFEAYYFRHNKRGDLINPTDRLPEHDFLNTFHMRTAVLMVNAVFSLNNSSWFGLTPYLGGGLGAARMSIRNATSFQISPEEPGINHFNSKRNDSTWTFAAQVKAGLRYNLGNSFHIFGEYRYLYLDPSNYIFGSTVYPTHAPTSPWNVKIHNIQYNAFVVGIRYDI